MSNREKKRVKQSQEQNDERQAQQQQDHRPDQSSLDVVPDGLIGQPPEMIKKQLNELDGFDR